MTSTALHSPAAVQSVDFLLRWSRVCSAGGLAVLRVIDKENRQKTLCRCGFTFVWAIERSSRETRLRGLMVGIELVTDRKEKTPAKAKTAILFEKLRAGGSGWKSLHGLIRGENMEHGRDSDTVGHVRYVVELARALASMPGMRPGGGPMANFLMPMVQQGQQGQRPGGSGRRVPGPDDATWADVPVPPGQNVLDASVGGITGGGMVSVSYDIGGMP
ncbi:hypothetical protein L2E82_06359 [Cichorium intybus]|uniref:Uncharacterized protein n=1 Tax=Cichorium intybus TaxID=13427 RepID=A0ACB9H9N6_CICIN|nr:hypothetical protein L2E82_06359 [Cichorium intybus]